MARSDDYKNNKVKFFIKLVKNEVASRDADQPVFNEVEYIHILKPGDKNLEIIRAVKDEDREIYEPIYNRFLAKMKAGEPLDGTPLDVFPAAESHDVEVLRNVDIHTVEQLAELSDKKSATAGPAIERLREKAIIYLQNAAGGNSAETITALKSENEQLRAELDEFKTAAAAEIAALKGEIEAMQNAAAGKKPGSAASKTGRQTKGRKAA